MKNNELENLEVVVQNTLDKAREVKLTLKEKINVKDRINFYIESHPIQRIESSMFFGFLNLRSVYLVPLALVLLLGGGLGLFVNKSPESELFYPVKIIGDEAVDSLGATAPEVETTTATFSATSNVEMQRVNIDTNLSEVKSLPVQGKVQIKQEQAAKKTETSKKSGKTVIQTIEKFFGINQEERKETATSTTTTDKSKKEIAEEKKKQKEAKRKVELERKKRNLRD